MPTTSYWDGSYKSELSKISVLRKLKGLLISHFCFSSVFLMNTTGKMALAHNLCFIIYNSLILAKLFLNDLAKRSNFKTSQIRIE